MSKVVCMFRAGHLLTDASQLNKPVEVDSDQIKILKMQAITNILKIFKSNLKNHLHQLVYISNFDVILLHKLKEKNLLDHRIILPSFTLEIECVRDPSYKFE